MRTHRPKKLATLDIREVFPDYREVAAILRSGQSIDLLDDDGRIVALIEPAPEIIQETSRRKIKSRPGLRTA